MFPSLPIVENYAGKHDCDLMELCGNVYEGFKTIITKVKKYHFSLFFINDNNIGTISSVPCTALGESPGIYTLAEIIELRKIKNETPEPDFTGLDPFEAKNKLIEYGNLIRSKLSNNQGENPARSVATDGQSE